MSDQPRSFLSIGEVLELLKDDFPDITISKIRFLESQGLIDPERTPSGYRKFHEPDVARLRWILQQQKEHFLPLKVIKDRIAGTAPGADVPPEAEPTEPSGAAPGPEAAPVTVPARPSVLDGGPTSVSMSLLELAQAAGVEVAAVQELERFGLLVGQNLGGSVFYDGEALVIARLATAMARHGLEPRHLRMYRNAAEREAALYEQVVAPLLKQRNPDARRQAAATVEELARTGEQLRAAFVRAALRTHVQG